MSLAYANNRGRADRIGVDVKLFWAAGLTIGIIFCQSLLALFALIILLVIIGFLDKDIGAAYRKFIWVAIPATTIILLIHLFYHSGDVLFKVWILTATSDGIKAGVLNSLRFLNFGLVAMAAFGGIEPVAFGGRIAWGLGLFRWRKLADLALVFFIAIRFMPSFIKEISMVKMAMMARGADFGGSIPRRIRMGMKLMLPLFSRVIRQADDIACAISLKGYKGTYMAGQGPKLGTGDIVLILAAAVLTVILIIL